MFPFGRQHGANPEKLYEATGLPLPDKIVDFSTNANVLPWDGWDELNLDLRRLLSSYPDDEATELRRVIAGREARFVRDCSIENVLIVNGSNEAVCLIASIFGGGRAALWQPVYGEYLRALSARGAEVHGVFDADGPPEGTEVFFLCNPCNPTGKYVERETLDALFVRHPDTLFVVDEAYVDFLAGEHRRLDFLRFQNLVVLRSLTKIFHLSGARIGYVLAREERIAQLRARQPAWSVNSVAQAAALAFMRDEEFVRRTRAFYATETPRFAAEIEKAGFGVLPTRTNFFLVEVADDQKMIRALLERGLVVRHTRNFPGLDGRYIRVATRAPEENDLLAHALSELR
ncbi:MAG: pyridoxal phosphate-dependent class II aminotransferase [Synergistaceae bacterium]|jgi:threonine-phosphate decarboxylase|nr:pyridoxal phosphate-dependent class II aminotransferase [Synergistaceae bacterium]